jgi:hypothetical protein
MTVQNVLMLRLFSMEQERRRKKTCQVECRIRKLVYSEDEKAIWFTLQPVHLDPLPEKRIKLWYHCSTRDEYREIRTELRSYEVWKFKFDPRTDQIFDYYATSWNCIIQ